MNPQNTQPPTTEDVLTPADSLEQISQPTNVTTAPASGAPNPGAPSVNPFGSPDDGSEPDSKGPGLFKRIFGNKVLLKAGITTLALAVIFGLVAGGTVLYQRRAQQKASQSDKLANIQDQAVPIDNGTAASNGNGTLRVGVSTLFVNGDISARGNLAFSNNGYTGTVSVATLTSNQQYVLPNASGTICLSSNNCNFTVNGTTVTSINGATGPITLGRGLSMQGTTLLNSATETSINGLINSVLIANSSTSGQTITINDASTTSKGIAQFDSTNFTATNGSINLVQNIDTTATPTFAGLILSSALGVQYGGTGATTLAQYGVLVGNGTGAVTSQVAGAGSLCLMSNAGAAPTFQACPGGGAGAVTVSSPGSVNTLSKFTGTNTIADSSITDDGATVTINAPALVATGLTVSSIQSVGAMTITPGGILTIGATNQIMNLQGNSNSNWKVYNSGNVLTFGFTAPTANRTINLPDETGTVCLQNSVSCGFATGGSGVTSVNALAGALTIANATGAGSTITINNATTAAKGIAQFDSTNFTVSSGNVNTIQGISVSASPQFAGLTLTGNLTLGTTGIVFTNNIKQTAAGNNVTIDGGADNIVFKNQSGTNSFVFPTSGGLGQVICTSGITCASGGGQAVILEPSGVQTANANKTSVFINKQSGTGNLLQLQTGGLDKLVIDNAGVITLDNATVTNTLTTNTITPTGSLTIGATGQALTLQGNSSSAITATGGGYLTTVSFNIGSGPSAPTGNITYRFRNDNTVSPGTYDICTTVGNCTGTGGGVTTPGGTPGKLAKFTAAQAIADSTLSESGTTVTASGNLVVQGSSGLTLGTGAVVGVAAFRDGSSAFTATLQPVTQTANHTISLPNASGTVAVTAAGPLVLDATTGNLTCPTCLTSGGGGTTGVQSINSQTGNVTLNNATGSGGSITIDNASTAAKGIAQFNSTNFSVSAGLVNTIQDIATSSSPTFQNLNVQGATGLTIGSTTNLGQLAFKDGTVDGFTAAFSPATLTGNRTITVPNASGTLAIAATGNLSLSAAGTVSITNSPTFTTSVTTPILQSSSSLSVTPGGTGSLTLGAAANQLIVAGKNNSTITITDGASHNIVLGFSYTGTPRNNLYFNFPNNNTSFSEGGTYDICTSAGNCLGGGGGANTALSNLTGVAINTSLLTGSATIDLGSNSAPFRDLYLGGTSTNNFRFTGTASAARTITVPDASGTLAVSASGNIALSAGGNITFTGQLPVLNGGTGASDATTARSNLGAAASGANADITSTTALNTITPSGSLTIGATGQTFTLQGGASSSITATSGVNTNTLAFTTPSGGNKTIYVPNEAGTICIQNSVNCGFATSSGSGNYIQNQYASQQTANMWISGNARVDTSLLTPSIDRATLGALTIGNNNSSSITLGGTANNPQINVDSGTGTINLGSSANARTINIGNVAAAQTITIGSQTGSSSVVIQAGSGSTIVYGGLSSPGAGSSSERFGSGATAGGSSALAVGNSAIASNISSIAIGQGTSSSGIGSTSLGAGISNSQDYSIVLGALASSTAANQFVVGSSSALISTMYLGRGVADSSASASAYTMTVTSGSGTNVTGGTLNIASGRGTGSANSGNIVFQYAPGGTSGSSLNALQTACSISGTTGSLSCPGAGASSERFGSGATAAGGTSVAVGNAASASGTGAVAIGASAATSGGNNSVAIGGSATASGTGSGSVVIGYSASSAGSGNVIIGATATAAAGTANNAVVVGFGASTSLRGVVVGSGSGVGQDAVAIGQGITTNNTWSVAIGQGTSTGGTGAIAIGVGASAPSNNSIAIGPNMSTTGTNQLVVGSITSAYFGNGVTNATPNAISINATGGSGTDIAGAALTLAGGRGTGAAIGGGINFQTSAAGTTGTTLRSLSTVMSLAGGTGAALFQNTSNSATALQVQNAAGTTTVLDVDTSNNRVGINTAAPGAAVEISQTNQGANYGLRITQSATSINQYVGSGNSFFIDIPAGFQIGNASSASVTGTIIAGRYLTLQTWNANNLGGVKFNNNGTDVLTMQGSDNNLYLGNGVTSATPTGQKLIATGGSGTNIAGASLTLAGGIGTGTGVGGNIVFQYAPAGTTGSTANTLTTACTISGTNGSLSCPGAGGSSERFGSGAAASASSSVAIGNSASAGGTSGSVALGASASAGSSGAIAIGASASSGGSGNIAIGNGANASFGNNIALGQSASAGQNYSIAIGSSASAPQLYSIALGAGATTNDLNQLVVGSSTAAITKVFIGNGTTNASPQGFTLNATGGSGTNIAGASLTLAGGIGTGTGVGGNIVFQYAPAGTTGSTANTLTTACTISGTNGSLSCPGAGGNGERFGSGAAVTSASGLAVGINASASGTSSSVAIGPSASATASDSIALGRSASSSGSGNVAIGATATASFGSNIAVGYAANASGAYASALGNGTSAGSTAAIALGSGATTTGPNQLVIGSSSAAIATAFIGNGVTAASPQNFVLNATGGSGTNIAGASLTLAGGIGTGTGVGGNIVFQYAPAGSTGSLANTLTTACTISGTNGSLSCPGAGGTSERFGSGATAAGTNTVAVGNTAAATGNYSVALGYNASVSAQAGIAIGYNASSPTNAVVIGYSASSVGSNTIVGYNAFSSSGGTSVVVGGSASASGNGATAIGASSVAAGNSVSLGSSATTASASASIAIGSSATAASSVSGIAIGSNASTGGFNRAIAIGVNATATAANQIVFGSSAANEYFTSMYLGSGVTAAAPQNFAINATGGSGTDIAGASLTLAGGIGTGAGNGGSINLQVAKPGTTGTLANSLATVASFSGVNGSVLFQNSANSTSALQVKNAAGTTTVLGVDTSNTRVGINAATPSNTLDIGGGLTFSASGSSPAAYTIRQAANKLELRGGTSGFQFNNSAGSAALVVINDTGEVGIGGITPSASKTKLQVSSTTWAPYTGYQGVAQFYGQNTLGAGVGGGIVLGGVYTGTTTTEFGEIAGIKENATDGNWAGALTFYTRPNAQNAFSERLRIASSGDIYFGNGDVSATPVSGTLNATGGSGTNIAGASLTLAGGRGTGTGTGGNIVFQYAPAGSTGSALNALSTACTISGTNGSLSCPGAGVSSERFGSGATAAGTNGIAIGNTSSASNTNNIAIGANTSSTGANSTITIGNNTSNAGSGSVVIGTGSTASNSGGTTGIGDAVVVNAWKAIAIGQTANSSFQDSIAIGNGATTTATGQIVFGSGTLNKSAYTSMYLGSGVTAASPQNFTLNATGGSGTDIAGASLTLAGGIGTGAGNGGSINLQVAKPGTTGSSANSLATVASLSGVDGSATFQNSANSTSAFIIKDSGGSNNVLRADTTNDRVGIGTGTGAPAYTLDVLSGGADGTTVAQFKNAGATSCTVQPGGTGFACSSDARLKTNVATVINPTDTIKALRGVTFNWITDANGQTHAGFIAQELEQVIPSAVSTDSNGYKVANYTEIIPYLVGAAQAQDSQITGLSQAQTTLQQSQSGLSADVATNSAAVSDLTNRVATLEQQVTALQNAQGNLANLNVSGPATVQSLTVSGSATVASLTVTGNATFEGNIRVNGHLVGNPDTRGTITVPAGQTQLTHSFTIPYDPGTTPVVILTPTNDFAPSYRVTATDKDFTVYFKDPVASDLIINYQVQQ